MELYDHQLKAQKLLEQPNPPNILDVAPTGAGKTKVGEMAFERFGKGIYTVPTRALGYEIRNVMGIAFPEKKVVLGNKDWGLTGTEFKNSDIRVLTQYKLRQMLMSLGQQFPKYCPMIVFDEIHNMSPDTELIATATKLLHPSVHRIGLSATVDDEDKPKLANWLGATIVESDERPVPIHEHIIHFDPDLDDDGNEVTNVQIIESGKVVRSFQIDHALGKYEHVSIVDTYITEQMNDDAPRLVYGPYRWPVTQIANRLAESRERDESLWDKANELPQQASEFTRDVKTCLPKRVGIHHGGLSQRERELTQDLAQNKPGTETNLDVICTCETLAQGVNLPARHVIFDTIYQFDDNDSRRLMSVSKFRQIQGRAGRPQYDSVAHTWICVFSEIEKTEVEEILLKHKASKIESRIYNEYFLQSMVPMLIYFGWNTPAKFVEFIRGTYWGMSLQDTTPLVEQFERIVEFLFEQKAVQLAGGKILVLTDKGLKIARLGLHPLEYDKMERLAEVECLDYEKWIANLAAVCFEYVCGKDRYDAEGMTEIISETAQYGLSIYATKGTKHDSRQVVDYVQRLLDITRNFFRLNDFNGYSEEWNDAIYEKFMYGKLVLAHKLSDVLRADRVKRLIRNMGQALQSRELDDASQKELITQLWGHHKFISPQIRNELDQVARVLGHDRDEFYSQVVNSIRKEEVNNEV